MTENYAAIDVPTLRERVWRKLRFRFHLGDQPEGIEGFEGWMRTDIRSMNEKIVFCAAN